MSGSRDGIDLRRSKRPPVPCPRRFIHFDDTRTTELAYQAALLSSQGASRFDCGITPLDILTEAHTFGDHVGATLVGCKHRQRDHAGRYGMFNRTPFCYGLAAAGQDAIRHVFGLFRSEMLRTLRFMGWRSLDNLGPGGLRRLP